MSASEQRATKRAKQRGPATLAVAQKIRLLRTGRGLTLRALGELTELIVPTLGTHALNTLELGMRQITVEDLFAIAKALGLKPGVLLETPSECSACHGAPPPGFACLSCMGGAQ